MLTTIFTATLFLVLLVIAVVAKAYFLQLGARWARIGKISYRRAFAAIAVVETITIILGAIVCFIPTGNAARLIVLGISLIVWTLALSWLAIARILKTNYWRAAWAWVPTLVAQVGYGLLLSFVVNPYLIEPYSIPTNSMAPTIIGRHRVVPCPRCGSPAFSSAEEYPFYAGGSSKNPVLMICSREHRTCEVTDPPHKAHPGDKIIVNKLLSPRRWDIIVFKLPESPDIPYCKRLVGLPSETVEIRDGAVWIDGEKVSPPESCAGLQYLSEMGYFKLWGTPENPAVLGPDEYFVLGDFSARARDSRLWEKGAPGHPPYAVPEDYIIGVVTHIYWPFNRSRILR